MKIIALSDLHGNLPIITEHCDVVCIAGDIMPLDIQWRFPESISWISREFVDWVEHLDCKKGNNVCGKS